MKTKNIFNRLALALLMPAMLLTTACSNSDDDTVVNHGNTAQKGFAIPVTVNVTFEGFDATTRATYTDNGDGTGQLSFSSGDKLFVNGIDNSGEGEAGQFAGTLTWQSEGTFSGTITTEKAYSGTADELLTAANSNGNVSATLLPKGYKTYGYLSVVENNGYDAELIVDMNKAFATSKAEKTAKATAVEQLSIEKATAYSSSFALRPWNAILNFTITELLASITLDVSLTGSGTLNITSSVTTDDSGNATFAVGVAGGTDFNDLSLTVCGKAITLTSSSKELTAGQIYNISRNAPALPITSPAVGQVIGNDGKNYIYDNSLPNNGLPTGVTAVAKICYVDGDHGLALALADEGKMDWSTAMSTCKAHTPTFTDIAWKLANQSEWIRMINTAGGTSPLRDGFESVGGTNMQKDYYWSSTENEYIAWMYTFEDRGRASDGIKNSNHYVRACLAF